MDKQQAGANRMSGKQKREYGKCKAGDGFPTIKRYNHSTKQRTPTQVDGKRLGACRVGREL